jgi:hypothetical protein
MTTLDQVVAKIDRSNSTLNLYRTLSQSERITLNSTPCDRNLTGSCKGLVSTLTPMHYQAFDIGRETAQTLAQADECYETCMSECPYVRDLCHKTCMNECDTRRRKDFI